MVGARHKAQRPEHQERRRPALVVAAAAAAVLAAAAQPHVDAAREHREARDKQEDGEGDLLDRPVLFVKVVGSSCVSSCFLR